VLILVLWVLCRKLRRQAGCVATQGYLVSEQKRFSLISDILEMLINASGRKISSFVYKIIYKGT
jgi:hypothetical protein